MTREDGRWQRVQDLCVAALECDPADRDAFLTSACAGDGDLRQEIESLLAQDAAADRFLSASTLERWAHAVVTSSSVSHVGHAFGPYEIQAFIGAGGMGEVYRARDRRLHRDVAVKVLPSAFSGDPDRLRRFEQEARAAAALNHPNILAVYDIGTQDGEPYIVSECLAGETLAQRLARGPLSLLDAMDVAIQLGHALAAAHAIGIVHRDLKPANIFITPRLHVKVLDFGLAKMRDALSATATGPGAPLDESSTTPGIGTLAYMSPEQLTGARADPRLDVWSLGVVLYEMVTGQRPFCGASREAVAAAITSATPNPASTLCPGSPHDLDRVLNRAVAKNPDDRPHAEDLISDLLGVRLLLNQPQAGRPAADNTRAAFRAALSGTTSAKMLYAAIAAVILVAAFVCAIVLMRPQPIRQITDHERDRISSLVVRRLAMPPHMLQGRPSFGGTQLSFVDLNGDLSLFDLLTGHVQKVTNAASESKPGQNAEFSVPSPDGSAIAYGWNTNDGRYELRSIRADGTHEQVLLPATSSYPWPRDWSRDAKWIVTVVIANDRTAQLSLVSADTGAVTIVKPLGDTVPQGVAMSPDGAFIVYDAPRSPSSASRAIFIVRSNGAGDRRLVDGDANDTNPVWTPDGRRVVFASDRSGAVDLWSVPVVNGRVVAGPSLVYRNIGRMSTLGLTETGNYYCQRQEDAVDVYSATLNADGAVGPPSVASHGYAGLNISSAWSPDGRRIAYVSRRGLVPFDRHYSTLVVRDVTTNVQHELVTSLDTFLVRSWAPDAERVLVQAQHGLYTVDLRSGATKPAVVPASSADERGLGPGDWLPDGRVIYIDWRSRALLARDLRTGKDQVIFDLAADNIEPNTSTLGRGFRLSPDGHSVAYSANRREGTTSRSVVGVQLLAGGHPRELVQVTAPEVVTFQDWMPDGRTLLFTRFTRGKRGSCSLWRVRVDSGDAQPVGLAADEMRDVSVSPVGGRITYTAGAPTFGIWLLEHLPVD